MEKVFVYFSFHSLLQNGSGVLVLMKSLHDCRCNEFSSVKKEKQQIKMRIYFVPPSSDVVRISVQLSCTCIGICVCVYMNIRQKDR